MTRVRRFSMFCHEWQVTLVGLGRIHQPQELRGAFMECKMCSACYIWVIHAVQRQLSHDLPLGFSYRSETLITRAAVTHIIHRISSAK